ncbi:MAG: TfoX/Sxy family protein [Clostridia bacterium]|jgi:TfoX/Sxy family transcriptional regulator of competence genes
MASTQEYVDYVIEQLSDLREIASLKMMGEYVLYYQGKVFGGIYDNRFLVKITKSSEELMKHVRREIPYPGAKEMFLVEELEDREFLNQLIPKMAEDIPLSKKRKR